MTVNTHDDFVYVLYNDDDDTKPEKHTHAHAQIDR